MNKVEINLDYLSENEKQKAIEWAKRTEAFQESIFYYKKFDIGNQVTIIKDIKIEGCSDHYAKDLMGTRQEIYGAKCNSNNLKEWFYKLKNAWGEWPQEALGFYNK